MDMLSVLKLFINNQMNEYVIYLLCRISDHYVNTFVYKELNNKFIYKTKVICTYT